VATLRNNFMIAVMARQEDSTETRGRVPGESAGDRVNSAFFGGRVVQVSGVTQMRRLSKMSVAGAMVATAELFAVDVHAQGGAVAAADAARS
jgi:hypothetical protein